MSGTVNCVFDFHGHEFVYGTIELYNTVRFGDHLRANDLKMLLITFP